MKIFSVHHKSTEPALILSEGLETRFVKEGISWTAVFFTPLWLFFHRMWLVLFATLVLYAIAIIAAEAVGLDAGPALSLVLVVNIIIALEGNNLRRWTLKRAGYQEIGVVTGRSLEHVKDGFLKACSIPTRNSRNVKIFIRPLAFNLPWQRCVNLPRKANVLLDCFRSRIQNHENSHN